VAAKKIIVIGGGPAGLMAAGQAATAGAEVLLLEKMTRPARKLGITGKGRCNLTNTAGLEEFMAHFGKNGKFLRQAFNCFFSQNLVNFLNNLGIQTEIERGGRIFPIDNDAVAVADAMIMWARGCGVSIRTRSPVEWLLQEEGRIVGVQVPREPRTALASPLTKAATKFRTDGKLYKADAVILATGGKSYPATGSTGMGYKLAEKVGHTINTPRPALVPLETKAAIAEVLIGLHLKNVNVGLYLDGRKCGEDFGEAKFEAYGLDGPSIVALSKIAVAALEKKQRVEISIDLKPALDDNKLDTRLLRDFERSGKKQFENILKELLPVQLIPVCMQQTKIDPEKPGNQITSDERKRLRLWLKDFRFVISGHRGFKEAIITSGGIPVSEINPRTMESKILKSLYLAGEIIDIDADTGGYNLQAAFSTGYLAGISAAKGN
jgi:predicted Rossmann fold flavoprotein